MPMQISKKLKLEHSVVARTVERFKMKLKRIEEEKLTKELESHSQNAPSKQDHSESQIINMSILKTDEEVKVSKVNK
jgi:hypothetical protein